MRKQRWQRHLMQTCCGALIVFSLSGCITTAAEKPRLEAPQPPDSEEVIFESRPGGLFLSFDEYRKLEGNIIELRRYIDELTAQIEFYTGEIDEQRR